MATQEEGKTDVGRRFVAFIVDALIAGLVGLIPLIGGLLGAVYMLIRDGLMEGASLGKKLLKLKVINTTSGNPASYQDSLKRNLIFAIPAVLSVIPILGWVISAVLSAIIYIVEGILVLQDPKGRRLGDRFAETSVISEAVTSLQSPAKGA